MIFFRNRNFQREVIFKRKWWNGAVIHIGCPQWFQNGSSYLPIVDRIDLVLMYIQSVDDSAHAFVYFIG